MKMFFKRLAVVALAISLGCLFAVGYYSSYLPDTYYISEDGAEGISGDLNIESVLANESGGSVTLKLYGLIPIKSVEVVKTDSKLLIPGGEPIGVKLLTEGAVVVGTEEIKGECPAKEAGLRAGDSIIYANGKKIASASDLSKIIKESGGKEINIRYLRDGEEKSASFCPICTSDGIFKAGLLIRDGQAGIGTLTFIDPETMSFGALGHPISDFDTHKAMPLGSGEIVKASITSFEKGLSGIPGELCGKFDSAFSCGKIYKNCSAGIFGKINSPIAGTQAIPICYKAEVKEGKAQILTTVSGQEPKSYDIEIEKLNLSKNAKTKNIVIKVTDPELLSLTGGILHGMSGSPIIQDGKLVGAVTHVFVNDPTRGYGIFIENMLEQAE